ncbi:hypothetical protein TI39_contig474g00006 [Zymoseptoria brevis]|uniref:Uncharacterized protein n=1 Tax=Zymoseptoria brevis TaxID=1047168 RepID=A0A0F4GJU7_9PEZI|nr:hypothetical protein TI39_contig474g00006 [Zymoseptoria brevis]
MADYTEDEWDTKLDFRVLLRREGSDGHDVMLLNPAMGLLKVMAAACGAIHGFAHFDQEPHSFASIKAIWTPRESPAFPTEMFFGDAEYLRGAAGDGY